MPVPTPEEIRQARKKLGITQTELARRAGVSQAYIAKIESGQADPKLSTLRMISQALQGPPSSDLAAGSIASAPVLSVRPSDSVIRAVRLMERHGISQLPVIERGKQLGSISEGTILRLLSQGSDARSLLRRSVRSVMEEPFPTVDQSASLQSVISLLEHSPAVLTVDRERITGIITKADLFKLITGE